ncbi:MAG: T9SS type A sorting domain-containing protein [Bacteroidia bacterium]|nr:T9SS type A sorting domain-containing protein [Bacteroidia bacterium]
MKISTKFVISIFTLSIGAICISEFSTPVHGNGSGAPVAKTGSPGDGANCTQCHSGTPTTQAGLITSTIPGAGYTPGQTYTITASIVSNPTVKFGFEVSPQNTAGTQMGTLIVTNSTETQLVGSGKYITHKTAGTAGTGSRTWTFDWTAPAAGSGAVTFYGAFNKTNNSGTNAGDAIVLSSLTVQENTATSIAEESTNINVNVFPNPSSEHFTLSYELKENSKVEAKLISLTGQVVKVLMNEEQVAGKTEKHFEIDPSIAKGTYFVSVSVNGVSTTQKILIK